MATKPPASEIEIIRGARHDVFERAIIMQVQYYTRETGFNEDYGTSLREGLSKLGARIDHEDNEVWSARCLDEIVGTIFIDGEAGHVQVDADVNADDIKQARLTSFIVGDGFRGAGIGRRLLTQAIEFVDQRGFDQTCLWTFQGSDAARRLYEFFGFVLKKDFQAPFFGVDLTVQLFARGRNAGIRADNLCA